MRGDNCTITRSPFRYIGSKRFLIQKFRYDLYFPRKYTQSTPYIEMFCGSASMFFNLKPQWAVLNDSDNKIYNFFDVLQNSQQELEDELKYVWSGDKWVEKYGKRSDRIGMAVNFLLSNSNSLFYKPVRFDKKFGDLAEVLDNARVVIFNRDFRKIFSIIKDLRFGYKKASVTAAWIYEDPPYFGSEKIYDEKFSVDDHRDLSTLNHQSKHNIIISYSDSPLIRELYADWHIKEFKYFSRITNKKHVELLISNGPLVKHETVTVEKLARRVKLNERRS